MIVVKPAQLLKNVLYDNSNPYKGSRPLSNTGYSAIGFITAPVGLRPHDFGNLEKIAKLLQIERGIIEGTYFVALDDYNAGIMHVFRENTHSTIEGKTETSVVLTVGAI